MNTSNNNLLVLSELLSFLAENSISYTTLIKTIIPDIKANNPVIIQSASKAIYDKQPSEAFEFVQELKASGLLSELESIKVLLAGFIDISYEDDFKLDDLRDLLIRSQDYFYDITNRYRDSSIRNNITYLYTQYVTGNQRIPELEKIFVEDSHGLSDTNTFLYYSRLVLKYGAIFSVSLTKKTWTIDTYLNKVEGKWSGNPNDPNPTTKDPNRQAIFTFGHKDSPGLEIIYNNPQFYKYPASEEHRGYQVFILHDYNAEDLFDQPDPEIEIVGVHYLQF